MKKLFIFWVSTISVFCVLGIIYMTADFPEDSVGDNILGGLMLLMLVLFVFLSLPLAFVANRFWKKLSYDLEIKKTKTLGDIELQQQKASLDIELDHKQKTDYWTCKFCQARMPATDKNCSSCGASGRGK